MFVIFMGLEGAKRLGVEVLRSSCRGQATKGEVPVFMGGFDPSRQHGIDKYILLIKYIFLNFFIVYNIKQKYATS